MRCNNCGWDNGKEYNRCEKCNAPMDYAKPENTNSTNKIAIFCVESHAEIFNFISCSSYNITVQSCKMIKHHHSHS